MYRKGTREYGDDFSQVKVLNAPSTRIQEVYDAAGHDPNGGMKAPWSKTSDRKEYLSATKFYTQEAMEEERYGADESGSEDDCGTEQDETETYRDGLETPHTHVGLESQGKRRGRGPTKMESLWKEHDPNNKINLKINRFGQPCGLKTCKLTNFIGTLVKGKEISLAAKNWSKVERSAKEKLWLTVQGFFNVDESLRRWILRSASKKWKDFKVFLKRNYFDPNLSQRQNIHNGCEKRIPDPQWAWLVKHWTSIEAKAKSEKNKAIRAMQLNGTHTTGSRSFAVTLDQLELKEGRQVGRGKLYVVSHTKRNGEPVDKYSEDKIKEINSKFETDPSLANEEVHDGDVFSGLFPKERSGTWRGLGLLVGGSNSRKLAEIKAELQDTRNENIKLWSVVETLMKNQSDLQQQHNELKQMWLASHGNKPSDSGKKNEDQPKDPVEDMEDIEDHDKVASVLSRNVKISKAHAKVSFQTVNHEEQASLSSRNTKRSELANENEQEAVSPKQPLIKRKNEKTPPRIPRQKTKGTSTNESLHKRSRKFHTPLQKDDVRGVVTRGSEVGLVTPESDIMVAIATVQSTSCKLHVDCVEVLVNSVFNKTTFLPYPQGRITLLSGAIGHCIPWPRNDLVSLSLKVHHQGHGK